MLDPDCETSGGRPTRLGTCAVLLAIAVLPGCAVRRTTRTSPAALPPAPAETSVAALVGKVDAQSKMVRTMNATVELEPTTGSVYSGVIKEYRDVKAFVLLDAPDKIRMIVQAPVVRTTIIDMAANAREFKLSVPSKQKFFVGSAETVRPSKNSLENLRPRHILDALLVAGLDSGRDDYFMERTIENGRYHDVLTVVRPSGTQELTLDRKVWFDASTLEIERVELYEPTGALAEDVRYSDYQDFGEVRYPAHIELYRPVEDYRLAIAIKKATFNQPIPADKFELHKPEGEQLINLASSDRKEGAGGQ